ncbi:unnamed protein product [Effrenium voratum]|nr:unnamed protein product [Effrenium voratum]
MDCVRSRVSERPSTEQRYEDILLERLTYGQRALRTIRWQVSGTMASAGLILAFTVQVWLTLELAAWGYVRGWDLTMGWTVCVVGMALLVSAPLPDDSLLTRLSIVGTAVLFISFTVFEATDAWKVHEMLEASGCWANRYPTDPAQPQRYHAPFGVCVWYACLGVWNVFWNVLAVCVSLSVAMRHGVKAMQERLWRYLLYFFQVNVFVDILTVAVDMATLHRFSTGSKFLVGDITGLFLFRYAILPRRLHDRLRSHFEATERTAAAAGVASLVGNCNVSEALRHAKSRFRVIDVNKLEMADLSGNSPSVDLFERSVPASLGSCDAFVSHSWSDDPAAKWLALTRWRQKFQLLRGRSPMIWLDKACIDQSDIEANLRSLPIFLSGCNTLLILCGTSFLSRLWCVLELFTFVHMGGKTFDIDCIPILLPGQEEENRQQIKDLGAAFDVRHCDCTIAADKDKILSIIQTGFGSMDAFNQAIQRVMVRIDGLSDRRLSALMSASSSGSSHFSDDGSETDSLGSLRTED